ncbi:MAG: hypothetical protein SOY04_13485 [Clostridium celatum]|nr:hypothetical protein [Clostridium celatum]
MIAKQFSDIIQRFCMKEINKVISKYSRVNSDEVEIVEALIKEIHCEDLKGELFEDFEETLKIARELEGVNEIDKQSIISMFLGIRKNTTLKLSMKDVIEYYNELKESDYILLDGGHLIYKRYANLKGLARDILDNMLDDEWHIDRLFDKDSLISMWLEGTSKEEAIKELIDGVDIEELLELDIVTIYEDEYKEYVYAQVEI